MKPRWGVILVGKSPTHLGVQTFQAPIKDFHTSNPKLSEIRHIIEELSTYRIEVNLNLELKLRKTSYCFLTPIIKKSNIKYIRLAVAYL